MPQPLPPESASRLRLWRMGQRNHEQSIARRTKYSFRYTSSLLGTFIALTTPWDAYHYPGYREIIRGLMGLSHAVCYRMMRDDGYLSRPASARLSRLISDRIAALQDLQERVEAHRADLARSKRLPGYRALRMARAVAAKAERK